VVSHSGFNLGSRGLNSIHSRADHAFLKDAQVVAQPSSGRSQIVLDPIGYLFTCADGTYNWSGLWPGIGWEQSNALHVLG
jgi:hypothetical protein